MFSHLHTTYRCRLLKLTDPSASATALYGNSKHQLSRLHDFSPSPDKLITVNVTHHCPVSGRYIARYVNMLYFYEIEALVIDLLTGDLISKSVCLSFEAFL
jgi:hypothetical protein